MGHVIAVYLLLLVGSLAASAQSPERGALQVPMRAGPTAPVTEAQLYKKSHALVIGIDKYQNPQWPRLRNAVADAEAIAKEFDELQRFTTVRLLKDLTFDALDKALRDFFIIEGGDPEARLVVWFAGHGHTVNPDDPREEGYIVPADAPGPQNEAAFVRSSISMSDIDALMRKAAAKHVIAIFDSCFSGTIFKATRDASDLPPVITWAVGQTVRQMITSGDKKQKVADDGTFRRLVISALRGEETAALRNNNGFILGTELGLFLQGKISSLTARTATPQTPQFGKLNRLGFDRGEFVFKVTRPDTVVTAQPAPQSEAERAWAIVKDRDNIEVHAAFVRQFPDTVYAALAREKLASLKLKAQQIPPPTPIVSQLPAGLVPVFYGTDRSRADGPKRLVYGSDRARRLEIGRAIASVPKIHQAQNIERPSNFRVPYLNTAIYKEDEDPQKHFLLQEIRALARTEALASMSERLQQSKQFKGQGLVFVHGFNIGFDDAVFRASQLAYDLQFDGVAAIYSWPSGASVASYLYDRESAQQTERYFADYLETLLAVPGLERLNIVAHGLGVAPVLQALRELKRRNAALAERIGELVLAAPDVDSDAFENMISQIRGAARGITIYAATNDLAMTISRRFAGGQRRAGDIGELGPIVVQGADTIDISAANTAIFSVNHASFGSGASILSDMSMLLRGGIRPPDKRWPVLQRINTPKGVYWRLPS